MERGKVKWFPALDFDFVQAVHSTSEDFVPVILFSDVTKLWLWKTKPETWEKTAEIRMSPTELDLSSKALLALELWPRFVFVPVREGSRGSRWEPVILYELCLGLWRWVERHENISCFLFLFQEYTNLSICSLTQVEQEALTVGLRQAVQTEHYCKKWA